MSSEHNQAGNGYEDQGDHLDDADDIADPVRDPGICSNDYGTISLDTNSKLQANMGGTIRYSRKKATVYPAMATPFSPHGVGSCPDVA